MRATLIDLVYHHLLLDFEDKVEEKDECNFNKKLREAEEELFAELTEEQIEKVKHLEWALDSKLDYIHFESQKYLLNYAFRLGMEMQKAFDKDDYE